MDTRAALTRGAGKDALCNGAGAVVAALPEREPNKLLTISIMTSCVEVIEAP
jgi:hypothetical protein